MAGNDSGPFQHEICNLRAIMPPRNRATWQGGHAWCCAIQDKQMKLFHVIPLVLALGACQTQSSLSILSASESGISYRVKSNHVPQAELAADEYCRSRGRSSQLDRVSPVDNYANASFICN